MPLPLLDPKAPPHTCRRPVHCLHVTDKRPPVGGGHLPAPQPAPSFTSAIPCSGRSRLRGLGRPALPGLALATPVPVEGPPGTAAGSPLPVCVCVCARVHTFQAPRQRPAFPPSAHLGSPVAVCMSVTVVQNKFYLSLLYPETDLALREPCPHLPQVSLALRRREGPSPKPPSELRGLPPQGPALPSGWAFSAGELAALDWTDAVWSWRLCSLAALGSFLASLGRASGSPVVQWAAAPLQEDRWALSGHLPAPHAP